MNSLKQIEEKALHAIRYGERLKPERDWLMLLCITCVLILASALFNTWLFLRTQETQSSAAATATSTPIGAHISTVEELFADRAAEEARYRSEYQFVDPS